MHNISIQSMEAIFGCLLRNTKMVFWMRSVNYNQQLYISGSIMDLWGISQEQFYKHCNIFNDLVIENDRRILSAEIEKQIQTPDYVQREGNFFDIRTPLGMRHHKTIRFPIYDKNQSVIALAGIGEDFDANLTSYENFHNTSSITEQKVKWIENEIKAALARECNLLSKNDSNRDRKQIINERTIYKINDCSIRLTKRQAQCINQTISGASAKMAAANLFISQRTVEKHLDMIRDKAKCKNKLELINCFSKYFLE